MDALPQLHQELVASGWVTIELYPYIADPDLAARTALSRVQEIVAQA